MRREVEQYALLGTDGRGNQEHGCHILHRAGTTIGRFSNRPKYYPFWGDRSTGADSKIDALMDSAVPGGREKVSSEL